MGREEGGGFIKKEKKKKMAYLQNPFENFLFKGCLLFFSVSIKEFLKKKKKKR